MIKRESKSNTIFNQYLREKRKEGFYCYYEIKIAKGNTFYFRDIEINQLEGLPATEEEGLVWKFSDQDQRKKPIDGMSAPPLPSYLVIKFKESFYMIRIGQILKMIEDCYTQITLEQARKLAEKIIHI